MINSSLLKFAFVWNLRKKCVAFNLIYFGTAKYDCLIKLREIISSVTQSIFYDFFWAMIFNISNIALISFEYSIKVYQPFHFCL